MPVGSIVITNNPLNFEEFEDTLRPGKFSNLQIVSRDMGGFWSARFRIDTYREEAQEYLNLGPGRYVQIYTIDGRLDWEGYINSVTLETGSATVRATLDNMGNKVWTRYQPVGGGAVTRSTVYEDSDSQARFGVKHWVISGGEISLGTANQLAEKFKDLNFWVTPQLQDINLAGAVREPVLTFKCLGWWHSINWATYTQTILTGEADASTVVAAIVADSDIGQFILSTSIDNNVTQVTQEYDADRRAGDILESIANLGDSSLFPWVVGMGENRQFYYRQAARPI